jgi:hypothetical protein
VDDGVVGAMNLYARPERAFDDDDRDAALQFSAQAAIVLANAQAYWDAYELSARLGEAMKSRATIEQAKGILMLLTSCGDLVAFDLLAHISSHTHRKVRDVAGVITRSAAGQSRLPDDIRAIIRDACPPTQPLR